MFKLLLLLSLMSCSRAFIIQGGGAGYFGKFHILHQQSRSSLYHSPHSHDHSHDHFHEPLMDSSDSDDDDDDNQKQEEWEREDRERSKKHKVEFNDLLEKVISAEKPEDLPSIMSSHIDIILDMRGYEGIRLLKEVISDAEASGNEERELQVMAACEYIVSFTEEFVDQAKVMDETNKQILGKIIRKMTSVKDSDNLREEDLDEFLEEEKENFTPSFLRHLEGECKRIESAPQKNYKSEKLLRTLRTIQMRVVEELGKELGEAAQVLNQLIGYDNRAERIAVLETGLKVRGDEFAKELYSLTEEALDGFKNVEGEITVDPELLERITDIKDQVEKHINTQMSWE